MDWLLVGVSSTCLHASISIVDKILLEKYFKNNWAYPFFTSLFLGIYCLLIIGFRHVSGLFHAEGAMILVAMLPGFFHYLATIVSIRALRKTDPATVFGLSQISPFFAVIWGYFIFDNRYTPINYLGVGILVISAVFLAWGDPKQSINSFKNNRVLLLVIAGTFLRSCADLFVKFSLTELDFWDTFSLSRVGTLFPALMMLLEPRIRKSVIHPITSNSYKVVSMSGLVEILVMINLFLLTWAFSLGPLALVSATQATLPLFILLFSGFLNFIKPGIAPLRDTGHNNLTKVVLCFGIIIGVLMLNV